MPFLLPLPLNYKIAIAFLSLMLPLLFWEAGSQIGRRLRRKQGQSWYAIALREIASDVRIALQLSGLCIPFLIWGALGLPFAITFGIWLLRAIAIITVALIAISTLNILTLGLERVIERNAEIDAVDRRNWLTLLPFLQSGLKVLIYAIATVGQLANLGLDIAPILGLGAIASLVLGISAQSVLQDLIATLFLFIDRAYYRGSRIRVFFEGGEIEGEVLKITLRVTVLNHPKGRYIIHNRLVERLLVLAEKESN